MLHDLEDAVGYGPPEREGGRERRRGPVGSRLLGGRWCRWRAHGAAGADRRPGSRGHHRAPDARHDAGSGWRGGTPAGSGAVFDTAVDPETVATRVVDEAGDRLDGDDAGVGAGPSTIEVSLPPDLPAGTYTATWETGFDAVDDLEGAWRFHVLEDRSTRPGCSATRTTSGRGCVTAVSIGTRCWWSPRCAPGTPIVLGCITRSRRA